MKKLLSTAFILAALAAVFVYAKISAKAENFKQAEDFPRGALVYVQMRDLPALIKLWNDSELRRKYLESANCDDFKSNHLALKLAERAGEIEFGLSIVPDLDFVSTLSESSAAFAVYDVGKMEFVFIAPMSEEKILASALFRNQTGFEEIRLDDETIVYSKEIDVDRARQRQKIFFANFRGRLILATNEKYFLQTLDNIRGKTPKNRLSNEPLFRAVADKTEPSLATVWLNQEKLNDDWYFRHYWLMSETGDLKNLRAGMIDFEIQDKKLVEKRTFLTTETAATAGVKPEIARRINGLIPESTQFYQMERVDKFDADEPVFDVLFEAQKPSENAQSGKSRKDFYFRGWEKSWNYSYLDDDFSEQVDETFDEETRAAKPAQKWRAGLTKIINAAQPQATAQLFSPQNLAPPLFFDNRKALIVSLKNPSNLDQKLLENELSDTARDFFTAGNQKADFLWTDFSGDGFTVHQLTMASLGWKIFYARRQNELVFSGSEEFLKEILSAREDKPETGGAFEKWTVIDLENGRENFAAIFETIEEDEKYSGYGDGSGFFVENIGSLLDVASGVEKIEIRQTSAPNYLFEEIDFVLKQ